MFSPAPKRTLAVATPLTGVGNLIAEHAARRMEIRVLWQAASAAEAVAQCRRKAPRVLLASPAFRDCGGVEFMAAVRAENPGVRVLLFAESPHRELVRSMIACEVHGIVAAESPLATLATAISVVMEGGWYFDKLVEPFFHARKEASLSERERTVLRLVAEGFSTKEIAGKLAISPKTAEKFREHIMAKLDLHDAVRLTRYAIRAGLVPLE